MMKPKKFRHCVACGKQLYPGHRCPETLEARREALERAANAEPERTFDDRLAEAAAMRRESGDG